MLTECEPYADGIYLNSVSAEPMSEAIESKTWSHERLLHRYSDGRAVQADLRAWFKCSQCARDNRSDHLYAHLSLIERTWMTGG